MYPLKVILIGCGAAVRAPVRQELANQLAVIETELPDVPSTLRAVQPASDERRLFLVYLKTAQDVEQLKRLAGAFRDHPILGLRDAGSDQTIFTGAMRAGAAFVVSVPFEGDDLHIALSWIAKQFGYQVGESHLVAVSGVTGGCGATSMAINLAGEIVHRRGWHTILVDLSLRMGTLATCLSVEPRCSIHDLLMEVATIDVEQVRTALTPVCDGLDLLAGPQYMVRTPTPSWADVSQVIRHLKPLADVLVLHVPCTYEDLQFDALAAAEQSVLLMEQKIPAVRALQMVRQALLEKECAGGAHFVINRYEPRLKGFSKIDLEKLLHVPRLWTIAADPAVTAAINNGHLLRQQAPGSPVLADLDSLVERLLPVQGQARVRGQSGVFSRLVGAFGLT